MKGLILAGGYSSRMGSDKALLIYEGQVAWQLLKSKMSAICDDVFISCRAGQQHLFADANILTDQYHDAGPISGVLAALEAHPGHDWLVLAVDMPLISPELLRTLMVAPRPVFFRSEGYIEPLAGIYTAGMYTTLSAAFAAGQDSLQKILRQLPEVNFIDIPPGHLHNINTPGDYHSAIGE